MTSLEINDKIEGALDTSLSDTIIRALEKRDDGTFACPELKVLHLTGKVNPTLGIFVEMVEQRWGDKAVANQVASLEVVRVEFRERSQDHTEDVQVMKRLQSEGLLAYVFVKSGSYSSSYGYL